MTIPKHLKKPAVDGIKIGLILAVLLLQFRLLTFCLLAILVPLFLFVPMLRIKRLVIPAVAVVIVSMILPYDIALGSFHYGSREGTSTGGPHFVRFVVGMPMHTRLIQRDGEYISGGCTWPVLYPPESILVWN